MEMGTEFSAMEIPPCEFDKLDLIDKAIHKFLPLKENHDNLSLVLESQGYIPKLLEIFKKCEDLENIESLHTLFSIFKGLFMLEKNALFETMFSSEHILDIVGVLEYDPSKTARTPHREYINECVQFKEVIPIANKELLSKIHQTYRVQYIKDILVPVPLIFDDTGSTLHSYIIFNKIQILELIQVICSFLLSNFLCRVMFLMIDVN